MAIDEELKASIRALYAGLPESEREKLIQAHIESEQTVSVNSLRLVPPAKRKAIMEADIKKWAEQTKPKRP